MDLSEMMEQATADSVEIDFSTAVDFTPLEGEFPFKIEEAVPGVTGIKSKVPGSPKLTIKCVVIAGEKQGRKAQKDLPLSGEGAGITKQALSALGIDPDEVATEGLKLSRIVGARFIGVCQKSKFNEDFTDIKRIKPYVESEEFSL